MQDDIFQFSVVMSDEQIEGFKNTFLMFDKEYCIFKY